MVMQRWDPFAEMESLRDVMDRFFGSGLAPRSANGGVRSMPLDVYEHNEHVVVRALLPGMRAEDIQTTVERGHLTIRGRGHASAEEDKANYLLHEIWPGEFVRSLVLPSGLDGDKAEATYEDGILTLRIPKSEAAKPKQIAIKSVK